MTPVLALNMAINLIVAVALWLVWRRDRTQVFARYLALAGFVALTGPAAYLAWRQSELHWHLAGAALLVLYDSGYLVLLTHGVSHLAMRPLKRKKVLVLAGTLIAIDAVALALDIRLAQGISAVLSTAVGVLAFAWLRRQAWPERIAGLALILLGLNQFTFALLGHVGVDRQAGIAAALRVCLGFALIYAAVHRSATEARRLRDRFVQMTQNSHQGVAVIRGEEVLYANPALLRTYGISTLAEFGQRMRDATVPEPEREVVRARHRRLMSGRTDREDWEGPRYRIDGTPMRLRFSGWRIDWDGSPAEQVIVTDETEMHRATEAMLYSATHDELTDLPNRSALLQRLRELCSDPAVPAFALILLDVDRFKLFNDAHGHSLGDEVLTVLSKSLSQTLAGMAEVMRLGEDEFALVVPPPAAEVEARKVAGRVRGLLTRSLVLSRHEFFIDVSLGAALFPTHGREAEPLLRAATAAMRQAKRMPGTSLAFAEARFERDSSAVLDQEQALRAGIRNEEFSLAYQPKVDAATGLLIGFEALARWDRPGIGRISPLQFIPAAERTGLIGPLGDLILTLACHQISEWRIAFGDIVPVAVNVSPLQLLDPGFPDLVERTLRHFEVPARYLTLEITESAAVTHLEQACDQIRHMRDLGIEVALDDFGIGFSSLNMLRSLPLRAVKIDRSLIDPMPAPDATAVVRAICTLAGVLGLDVVAEGVESAAHAESAMAAGCHALQGFLFSQPVAHEVAARWIRDRQITGTASVA